MFFDEIKIETIEKDGKLYIDVEQLYNHIVGSTEIFANESAFLANKFGITKDEKYFVMGLIEGMWSIALMLGYGNKQYQFDSVQTVEDIMEKFWHENRTND